MKKINYILAGVLLISNFGTFAQAQKINTENSTINWLGKKIGGQHEGLIKLKSGTLEEKGDKIVSGSFLIDMTSLTNTDLTDASYNQKLVGHLKSDDFFGVEAYPTAALKMKKVKSSGKNSYTVTADFTMKDVTKDIEFEASIYGNKASASLKIDRTDYNVKYGSESFFGELKDSAIYDEFDIVIDLEF